MTDEYLDCALRGCDDEAVENPVYCPGHTSALHATLWSRYPDDSVAQHQRRVKTHIARLAKSCGRTEKLAVR